MMAEARESNRTRERYFAGARTLNSEPATAAARNPLRLMIRNDSVHYQRCTGHYCCPGAAQPGQKQRTRHDCTSHQLEGKGVRFS